MLFKEKALLEVVGAHATSSFACTIYVYLEQYIKPVAHHVKAPMFICAASHEKLALFIINMHVFSRPLSCPLQHSHIRMHGHTQAHTYTRCLLRLAPAMPCICLVIFELVKQ